MNIVDLIHEMTEEYSDYRRDESRSTGNAQSIAFPHDTHEVAALIASLPPTMPVTVQGARTGLAGGAVPQCGLICSCIRMNRITALRYAPDADQFFVTVQPGVLLESLNSCLAQGEFDTTGWEQSSLDALAIMVKAPLHFFPPDPTETTASIGGMVACNSSGARTFLYGPTRPYVESLRVVLSTGEKVFIRRGAVKADSGSLNLLTEEHRAITVALPTYQMPLVKNAAGLFFEPAMDAIDLFIGSEGVLGVITEIELRLVTAPSFRISLMAFFPNEASALRYVRAQRGKSVAGDARQAIYKPAMIEFFNASALDLLRIRRIPGSAFAWLPKLPSHFHTAVFVEFHGGSEHAVYEAVADAANLLEASGGSEEGTWIADNSKEMEKLRKFRHAVPELVNLRIDEIRKNDSRLTKLGTDMAVPDAFLEDVMALYNKDLTAAHLESVIFGHVGNNHVHVNIIPASKEEYQAGKGLYEQWAQKVIEWGGTVSGEHGIGRLKKHLLLRMYGAEGVAQMKLVKKMLDPELRLNSGVMFD